MSYSFPKFFIDTLLDQVSFMGEATIALLGTFYLIDLDYS